MRRSITNHIVCVLEVVDQLLSTTSKVYIFKLDYNYLESNLLVIQVIAALLTSSP